jgi:hypothetical protein
MRLIPQWKETEPQNSLRLSKSWEERAETVKGCLRHLITLTTSASTIAT